MGDDGSQTAELRYVCLLDTETTGLDPANDRTIEVAVMLYDLAHAQPVASFASLIRADSNASAAVNGIPPAMLADAREAEPVWRAAKWVVEPAAAVVAHNAEFDRQFCPDMGRPWVCSENDIRWPGRARGGSLVQLALSLGLGVASAHRAMADVDTLARVLTRLAERGAGPRGARAARDAAEGAVLRARPVREAAGRQGPRVPVGRGAARQELVPPHARRGHQGAAVPGEGGAVSGIADWLARQAQAETDKYVRPEIQALIKRGDVTPEETARLRCNSWEWEALVPAMTDDAFVQHTEHALNNCSVGKRPFTVYDDAVVGLHAPELLRRFKAAVGIGAECIRCGAGQQPLDGCRGTGAPCAFRACVVCRIEAEIGTEDNPHPVPERFHTCRPADRVNSIDRLDMSVRLANFLANHGCETVQDARALLDRPVWSKSHKIERELRRLVAS